jgi:hypothetical protein
MRFPYIFSETLFVENQPHTAHTTTNYDFIVFDDIPLKIGNIRYIVDSQAFNWQQKWLQVGNRSATFCRLAIPQLCIMRMFRCVDAA